MRKVVGLEATLSYALALSLTSGTAIAADASRAPAGTANGAAVEAITLKNGAGVSATILTYGATLQSLVAPGKDGRQADVLLGYDDLKGYVDFPNYFGVTVGAMPTASRAASSVWTARPISCRSTTRSIRCTAAARASTSRCGRSCR
jgi:hypothetical protein